MESRRVVTGLVCWVISTKELLFIETLVDSNISLEDLHNPGVLATDSFPFLYGLVAWLCDLFALIVL
jgi:hypothetical protein